MINELSPQQSCEEFFRLKINRVSIFILSVIAVTGDNGGF